MNPRQRIFYPTTSLLQGAKYIPAAQTDITQTWRKHGWIPQDELRAKAKQTVRKAKENSNVG